MPDLRVLNAVPLPAPAANAKVAGGWTGRWETDMQPRNWALFLVATLLALAMPARAEVMDVEGARADLALPPAYCKITRENAAERVILEQQDRMQAGNNLPVVFGVPCSEIANLRAGKPLIHWALWLRNGPAGRPQPVPPTMQRTDVIDMLVKAMPTLDADSVQRDLDKKSAAERLQLTMNSIGVLAHDSWAVYYGILVDLQQGEVKRTVAGVVGQTTMAGTLFSFNLFEDYKNKATYERLLDDVKAVMSTSVSQTDALAPVQPDLPSGMKRLR